MEIQLKGWPAVIAIFAVVICFVGYQFYLHDDLSKNPQLRKNLEINLSHEIAGSIHTDVSAARNAMKTGNNEKAEAIAKGLLERKVTIDDLAMKGGADDIIIRAEYTVHGPDKDIAKTGYFRYSHSPITGWRYRRETTAFSWYLKLF